MEGTPTEKLTRRIYVEELNAWIAQLGVEPPHFERQHEWRAVRSTAERVGLTPKRVAEISRGI